VSILLYLLAIMLIGAVSWDAFITVFSTQGAGPLTGLWTQRLWKGLLWIHRHRSIHLLLALAGPLMLIGVVFVWYSLLAVGWVCFFAADPESIVNNQGTAPADFLRTLYFVGTTISSVGYGDFVPGGFPWTFWANFAAFTSTVLLTTSLSYLLPIISASIERKYLAQRVFSIGTTVDEFLATAWSEPGRGALDQYILQVISDIDSHAHKHLVYPILHYFHSVDPERAPSRAMLLFADAHFLISHVVRREGRPPAAMLKVVDSCINNYAGLATSGARLPRQVEEIDNREISLEMLRTVGLPSKDEDSFEDAARAYEPRRRKLIALCWEDGWNDA
jgi:hypothetical protein